METHETNKTNESTKGNAEQNRILMGILAYLSILVIIPILVSRDDEFVKFHIKQGLVLLTIEIAILVLENIFWTLAPILNLLFLVALVFTVLGIINVVQNKKEELPLIGSFSRYFSI